MNHPTVRERSSPSPNGTRPCPSTSTTNTDEPPATSHPATAPTRPANNTSSTPAWNAAGTPPSNPAVTPTGTRTDTRRTDDSTSRTGSSTNPPRTRPAPSHNPLHAANSPNRPALPACAANPRAQCRNDVTTGSNPAPRPADNSPNADARSPNTTRHETPSTTR
ncbi:hypothetical protein Sdagh_51950 [Streptomyces daghestanicus]|uniref:Uncharacterized protein n=1 Tax=Streptomyces daghestanicus TaxID=66885 RepID=A0ABQ3Q858_9ACTN|nr:hypothetical protein Sdagh_51950 [Streptomyces daghestanicus]